MSAVTLSASGLAWSVDSRFVLLDLDLELSAGELVVLRGDNGSGKTTLLHLLCGRLAPDEGSVSVVGTPLQELDPGYVGSRIGWLGHKPGLYLDLSAHENLQLFAAVAGRELSAQQATQALTDVGLHASDHKRPVRTFSRGMKQRAGLARVAISGADIWLLDEPMTGLDASGKKALLHRLQAAARAGTTIVCASHDADLAEHADRVLQLRDGCLNSEAQ